MWDCVDPVIQRWEEREAEGFPNYQAGTWGPEEGLKLLARDGRNWITQ
jgi:glucose-6-phosphate 1-dehydrogenase